MSSVIERPYGERRAAQFTRFRVAILVGSEIVRQGLAAMLRPLAMVEEVDYWEWDDVSWMPSPSLAQAPDLLIVGCEGVDVKVIDKVTRNAGHQGAKVLLLLGQGHEDMLDLFVAIPGNGFLMQHELSSDSLAAVLADVAEGDTAVPRAMAQRLLARAREGEIGPPSVTPNLTPREKDVLELLVAGLSNKQIARQLNISQHGVKRLVSNVLAKLGCPNRTLAVAMAITERILAD